MIFPYEEFDLSGIKTYPLKSRKSKVTAADVARPADRATTIGESARCQDMGTATQSPMTRVFWNSRDQRD